MPTICRPTTATSRSCARALSSSCTTCRFTGSQWCAPTIPGVNEVLSNIGRSLITYGTNDEADVRAENIEFDQGHTHFDVVRPGDRDPLRIELHLPGMHNVRNALATIAVADELQIGDDAVVRALAEFEGIDQTLPEPR